MIKHSLFAALLLLSLFVTCRAQLLTEHYVVEFQQSTGSPDKGFSIKHDRSRLSGEPSVIVDTDGYGGSDSLTDDNPHRSGVFGVRISTIESLSWQLLYATGLLVGYELILKTRDGHPSANPCSWLPMEAFAAVGLLLKSYWNPDSPMFNPSGQHPFAITTMMLSPGHGSQQGQPRKSSGQQGSGTTTQHTGTITSLQHSDSDDGNGHPEQQQHTLGLNCFVDNCHGACKLRQSQATPEQSSMPNLDSGDQFTFISHAPDHHANDQHSRADQQKHSTVHLSSSGAEKAPSYSEKKYQTGQATCFAKIVRKDDQMHSGTEKTQSYNENKYQTGQATCFATVVGKDSQMQSYGIACREYYRAMSMQKRRKPNQKITCDETVREKYGQRRPCKKACMSERELELHKKRDHSGQKICDEPLGYGVSGPPCHRVFSNALVLERHKRDFHCIGRRCMEIVVSKDGKQQPCLRIFSRAEDLRSHKQKAHQSQSEDKKDK
ncbi:MULTISPECIES: hypothetical protein [unclassified Endozoicomonas]|uniref:hypothetical protein n=1 Tax=unclassified Endozoicomonas TaxID=2644528 RepID=UPI0021494AC0|nr:MULTISPECIES: hypothetical protein [unclassified Endozoicomonas]